jgi:hypothetical protein
MWFKHGGARVAIAVLVWLLADVAVAACPICFQVEDAGVTAGVRAAVAVLGGVTGGVLIGVAVFARRLIRTERAEQK